MHIYVCMYIVYMLLIYFFGNPFTQNFFYKKCKKTRIKILIKPYADFLKVHNSTEFQFNKSKYFGG